MKTRRSIPILGLAALTAMLGATTHSPGFGASYEPPDIQVNEVERVVFAGAYHDSDFAEDEVQSTAIGPFDESVAVGLGTSKQGSTADAGASQETRMDSFSLSGEGMADATANLGAGEFASAEGAARSRFTINFSVPVETPFTLTGSLSVIAPTDFAGEATMGLAAFGSTRGLVFESEVARSNGQLVTVPFEVSGTFDADQPIQFSIEAVASPQSDDPVGGDSTGSVVAWFNFDFNLGDRDGDGLLDSWETDGIDFDGDGTAEIDLPALGADPDHKDIFVELDVMEGVPLTGLDEMEDLLVAAFDAAPPELVENPGGEPGISLHIVRDGDRPVNQPLLRYPGDGYLPPEFFSIRENYFGSAADRNHEFAEQILEARSRIFRYSVFVDTLVDTTVPEGSVILGVANGAPSTDFIVVAGTHHTAEYFENVLVEALASTFMHELGHTLGLRHGGRDDLNCKPHYISVMNRLYGTPYDVEPIVGLDLDQTIFRLDYSRLGDGVVLDEAALLESQGVLAPPGTRISFNTAAPGEPSVFAVAPANTPTTDWNLSGTTDPAPYPQDLNRFAGPDTSDPSNWNASYSKLVSATDWDRLIFNIRAAVDPTRGGRGVLDSAPIGRCLDEDAVMTMLDLEWIDATAEALIFADGFESGDVTAWN